MLRLLIAEAVNAAGVIPDCFPVKSTVPGIWSIAEKEIRTMAISIPAVPSPFPM